MLLQRGLCSVCQAMFVGAGHEMLTNAREFGDIKKRGRWEADRSLKRYAKGGRVQEQLQRLRPLLQAQALGCAVTIGGTLCRT